MPPFEHTGHIDDGDDMVGLFGRPTEEDGSAGSHPVSLAGVQVKAEVVDFTAEVQLTQRYHNTSRSAIEGTYYFPVDEAAAVCGFEAKYEDGTVVQGVVKEKEEARKAYRQAIQNNQQANLLESVRRDIFKINVGNVPAGSYVTIAITYVTTLKAREDAVAFILPTHIAPRYTPQDAVTSKEALSSTFSMSPTRFTGLDIIIKFTARSDIISIQSPTHDSEQSLSCHFEGKTGKFGATDITMDKDLVVLVTEKDCHQPRATLEVSDDGTMTGFVTLFPEIEFPDQPRELIFVIDRSGSMSGQKIQQARDALMLFLRALPADCSFNIIGFGTDLETLFEVPQPYNMTTLEQASRYASNMEADLGGTDMLLPLTKTFHRGPPLGTERQVFVLCDGQVSNDKQVFEAIERNCTNHSRLFTVGIGRGVSRHLLEGMARVGRGTARFVEESSSETLRVRVLGQLKQALQPALDDVSVEWIFPEKSKSPYSADTKPTPVVKTLLGYRSPTIDESTKVLDAPSQPTLYPSRNPPVFNREQFLSFAMFPPGTGQPIGVKLSCKSNDGPLQAKLLLAADEVYHGSIARKLAARVAIVEYEDGRKNPSRYCPGESRLSEHEILEIALTNSLVSEKTAFVAIREGPVSGAEPGREQIVMPQEDITTNKLHNMYLNKSMQNQSAGVCLMRSTQVRSGQTISLRPAPPQAANSYTRKFVGGLQQLVHSSRSLLPMMGASSSSEMSKRSERSTILCLDEQPIFQVACMGDSIESVGADVHGMQNTIASMLMHAHQDDVMSNQSTQLVEEALVYKSKRPKKASLFSWPRVFASKSLPKSQVPPSSNKAKDVLRRQIPPSSNKADDELRRQVTPSSKKANDALRRQVPPSSKKADNVLRLCLLQQADGSFLLNDELQRAIHIPDFNVTSLRAVAQNTSENPVLIATALAIASLREMFPKQRDVWELQEGKAVRYLSLCLGQREMVDSLISAIQGELIRKLKAAA